MLGAKGKKNTHTQEETTEKKREQKRDRDTLD